jgi:polysaccharide pyruvyl transferase WcaK-like protein
VWTVKLGLLNLYSTRNLGDAAIYAALASMSPDKSVSGVLKEHDPSFVEGFLKTDSLASCTGFISVGGDIFNNARPRLVTRRFLENLQAIRRQPHATFLFGQSIPRSCRAFSFYCLSKVLTKLSSVTVRDEESFTRLSAAGVKVNLSYDTAFALPQQVAFKALAQNLFDSVGLDPTQTILVSLRNQSSMYAPNEGEKQILGIVQRLVQRGHQVGLVIQAQGDAADTDWTLAQTIQTQVPQAKIFNPFSVQLGIEPWSVLTAALGLARSVVAVRYHAAVLRMVEGKQAYVLHYSNKGEDLCKRLQQPGSKLGDMEVHALVQDVEKTIDHDFQAALVQRHVKTSFEKAVGGLRA